MAEELDFNDVLEGIFLAEETQKEASYQDGYKAGVEAGNPEGYHLGYHRGAELGRELGYYFGTVTHYLEENDKSEIKYSVKIINQLQKVQELIKSFPRTNSEEHDILGMAEAIRAQYKKNRYAMEATAHKIRQHLDSIVTYITPLLPLANCHMVEFFTQNHWERLVPTSLRNLLDEWDLNYAVEKFWSISECDKCDSNELTQWVHNARSHCLTVNNEYCLSKEQLQNRIRDWGGGVKPEIKVKEFMTGKKSYEKRYAMEATAHKIRQHLDSIITYINPLLPLANCHMVEFFTQSHWERLVPTSLRNLLDEWDLNYALEKFWSISECDKCDSNELTQWVHNARSHCLTVNNEYCLSKEQLQNRIRDWGGGVKPEIKVKEFMTGKKSYEVQTMSHLVASLHEARKSTHCVEAGGGRGHLLVALSLGYGIPSLTVDCQAQTLANAMQRVKIIQKQWHVIAKKVDEDVQARMSLTNANKHRFTAAYVTPDTDFKKIVHESFPDHTDDVRVLLTGLHTCGDLGPDCLRIFCGQNSNTALMNVPCCYHLLTEPEDSEKDTSGDWGFPMSRYLKGYRLGRNARMLASQSIDRVVAQRQMPADSLLYRALLQVIIKKYLPNHGDTEGKLKRVASKCQNFEQYFKMADATLELGIFDSLSDSYLTDILKNMNCQKKKIVLFYLLRMCLAQVVESVILLDRLLFLVENGFQDVYLVKLFDPVLSPRCHSIVAIR